MIITKTLTKAHVDNTNLIHTT